ncbi:hypothetical protein AB0B66_02245 [Catellatospora sp. NPDC049111]|uniref:hypothetical protein n=1 Tax=Catellatospora sp. NPDC049111 TaxID=3155271 RepID=UPI0034079B33
MDRSVIGDRPIRTDCDEMAATAERHQSKPRRDAVEQPLRRVVPDGVDRVLQPSPAYHRTGVGIQTDQLGRCVGHRGPHLQQLTRRRGGVSQRGARSQQRDG